MTDTLAKEAENFLHRFRRSLSSLPADIRDDIVAEVRSHMTERASQGPFDVEQAFGTPEKYAARFVAEQTLSTALEQGTSLRLVRALLATARDTAVVVFAVIPLAVFQLMALITAGMGIAKPFYGDNIGLFVGPDGTFRGFGTIDKALGYREVLGYAGSPLMIASGLAVFWVCNRLFVLIARTQLARIRPSQK